MLREVCFNAGIASTLMFMTPAVPRDYGVQKHHGQRYRHVYAHRNYVRRPYMLPRGAGYSAAATGRPSMCTGPVTSGDRVAGRPAHRDYGRASRRSEDKSRSLVPAVMSSINSTRNAPALAPICAVIWTTVTVAVARVDVAVSRIAVRIRRWVDRVTGIVAWITRIVG